MYKECRKIKTTNQQRREQPSSFSQRGLPFPLFGPLVVHVAVSWLSSYIPMKMEICLPEFDLSARSPTWRLSQRKVEWGNIPPSGCMLYSR